MEVNGMLYALICKDKPGEGLALRPQTRPAHLAYLESLGPKVKTAGALWDDSGASPIGSLLIIEAADIEEARALAAADPYARAGVFESVEVRPWKYVLGAVRVE
jgi:uncharacterized protein YciI